MTTVDQLVDRVRSASRLNRPDPNKLPETDIAVAIVDVGDDLITRLNQTTEAWLEGRKTINVQANVGSYILGADNYSKGRYLWTADSSNPNHNRRQLTFTDREQLTNFYGAGDAGVTVASGGYHKHNSQAAAIYYDSNVGEWKIEFGPVPGQQAQYDFFFEPATERPQDKNSIAFRFPQFAGYVADKVALKLVKACEWEGLGADESRLRREEIRGDLIPAVADGDKLFWQWRQSMVNKTTGSMIGFGWSRW